jgi:hypothetical protein
VAATPKVVGVGGRRRGGGGRIRRRKGEGYKIKVVKRNKKIVENHTSPNWIKQMSTDFWIEIR